MDEGSCVRELQPRNAPFPVLVTELGISTCVSTLQRKVNLPMLVTELCILACGREMQSAKAPTPILNLNFRQSNATMKCPIINACGFRWNLHIWRPIILSYDSRSIYLRLTCAACHFNKWIFPNKRNVISIFQTSFSHGHIRL